MKIAINTRFLLEGKLEGIGWFSYETVKRITTQHPEHQFYLIFDRPFPEEFIFAPNVTPVICFPQARHPFLWYWWFEHSLPKILNKIKPDVFISLDGYQSLAYKGKSIAVIHDLNFEHYPEKLKWLVRKYLLYYFPRFAKHATRIITVSEFSKSDISQIYKIDPAKIDVAHNGANLVYHPLSKKEKLDAKKTFANNCEYFVYIGALLPRKNVARMLQAFDAFKEATRSNIKMVIIGAKMFNTKDIEHAFKQMKYKADVIFTGRLAPGKIEMAMGGALALTYVSYFEGFGIPLVEAMYADVPVITSSATSLPEVAGDAALITDPFSVSSIKEAMIKISTDENLRYELIEKGRIQRQKFSWDNTANAVWESILKCANTEIN